MSDKNRKITDQTTTGRRPSFNIKEILMWGEIIDFFSFYFERNQLNYLLSKTEILKENKKVVFQK